MYNKNTDKGKFCTIEVPNKSNPYKQLVFNIFHQWGDNPYR